MIKIKCETEKAIKGIKRIFNAMPTVEELSKAMFLAIKNSGISLKDRMK